MTMQGKQFLQSFAICRHQSSHTGLNHQRQPLDINSVGKGSINVSCVLDVSVFGFLVQLINILIADVEPWCVCVCVCKLERKTKRERERERLNPMAEINVFMCLLFEYAN